MTRAPTPRPTALWPFDPRRVPFFYGWAVAVAGTLGMLASVPGQTNGVSVFADHLLEATGLGRTDLANSYLVGTVISSLLLPIGGRWIDRFGCRVVGFGATLGLAGTLAALSFVGPMGSTTGLLVMTIGFAGLRFSGQGLLTLASRTMVAQWFDQKRGRVTAVSSAAFSFIFSATPSLLFALIAIFGFRGAWRVTAAFLVVVIGMLVAVLYRHRPEDCGLFVDGNDPRVVPSVAAGAPVMTTSEQSRPSVEDRTRQEAVRTRQFWIITIPVVSMAAVSTALTFHIIDLGREMGIDENEIVRIFIPIALVSVPITLLTGWLSDRIPVTRIAVAMSGAQLVMYLTVRDLDDRPSRLLAMAAWGAAAGCFAVLTSAALPRLFGRTHLGAIAGLQMSAMVFGSAIGPAFFAWVQQQSGSYRAALLLACIGPVTGLVLGLSPVRRRQAG